MSFIFSSNSTEYDWLSILAVAADIGIVIIAVASLWVALSALRHQRDHDHRVMRHELRMAEPKVAWAFGPSSDGTLKISLANAGCGAAIRVRFTLVMGSQELEEWSWKQVHDAVRGDGSICDSHWYQTEPLSIFSGDTVDLVEFGVSGLTSQQVLNLLLSNVELRFYYKSNLEERILVTEWSPTRRVEVPD